MNDLLGMVHQCRTDTRRWFPNQEEDLGFQGLALAGEVGELCNLIKKVERGSMTFEEARDAMGEEAADVLIYLCNIFATIDVDPTKVYAAKRRKNELRFGKENGAKHVR